MIRTALGFSLIELLVVLAIILAVLGMAIAIPRHEEREAQVRGAAEELASVLRETRERAIRQNCTYAVVFNIENEPGSSGKILNNRSGGHWYRVLGPHDAGLLEAAGATIDGDGVCAMAPFYHPYLSALIGVELANNGPWPALRHYLELVSRSWIDEPHRLARRKVRFLALTDQDNGGNFAPSEGTTYGPTYPRPWFGWWDEASRELHAWGGYDTNLKWDSAVKGKSNTGVLNNDNGNIPPVTVTNSVVSNHVMSHTGFFYEGYEGPITGCVNPMDRWAPDDADNDGRLSSAEVSGSPKQYIVSRKGEPRPLINGNWVDCALVFRPDGSVDRDWFRLRQGGAGHFVDKWHDGAQTDSTTIPSFPREIDGLIRDIGLGDRCNGFGYVPNLTDPQFHYVNEAHPMQREATDFTSRHGYFWTTLAPDVLTDDSQFSSAEAAIKSMTPMYRVGVSVDGEVTVIRVRTTPEGPSVYDRGNSTLDATITGSDWDLPSKIWGGPFRYVPGGICDGPNYYGHMLREADGSPRGFPVVGSLWPDMLRNRVWWWQ